MKTPSSSPRITLGTWTIVALSSIVAVLGLAAVWTGLSVHFRGLCMWMLVVVSLDAALLLRLAGLPGGRSRLLMVGVVSVLTVLVAAVLIAASQIGLSMGLPPSDAFARMSPGLGWMYLQAQLQWHDALWLLPALALGWRLGR